MTRFKIAAAAAVGLLLQAQSFAGALYLRPITVGPNSANGSVYSAQNSTDSLSSIGCYTSANASSTDVANSTSTYLSCGATDSSGHSYYCYINNPPLSWLQLAASINVYSWVYVYGDAQGHCLTLDVSKDTEYF